MGKKIVIDPVTRVEGHGKVTIHLNEQDEVENTYFHITEFRGFERLIQGHPYWVAPVIVQRLCGICPVSHHLAAAKAIDMIAGITPEQLSPTATKIRRLLHYGQVFQSHALHFFYLAAPDLLLGADAPVEERNVVGVALANKELARKGILMRKFGQEIIKTIAGKKIHGIAAVPGGVHKSINPTERVFFLNDEGGIPSIDTMISWSQEVLELIKNYHLENRAWLDPFAEYPSGHMGIVSENGDLELYEGKLRAIDAQGNLTLPDVPPVSYMDYISEGVERWSYMKFPYLKHLGRKEGWNRVGPIARMNVANQISTPLAEKERKIFREFAGQWPVNKTMYSHWARLIELLHCAEVMQELLLDPDILGTDLRRNGERQPEGIGVIEAPRGTLIHHYKVDERDRITKCNLIVSTTHNNEAMNKAVKWVVDHEWKKGEPFTSESLNHIEMAIRAYDPCLSCATHALGDMPLNIEIYDAGENLIDRFVKS